MWLCLIFACLLNQDLYDSRGEALDQPQDRDGDGFPGGSDCQDGPVSTNCDCDDDDAGIHPDAQEIWYDGIDSDCLGDDDYDADRDGQHPEEFDGGDCDDGDASIYSGAEETWWDAGIDNDCDGSIDDAVTLNVGSLSPLEGRREGDVLGARMTVLEPAWSGTEAVILAAAPGARDGQGEVFGLRASELNGLAHLDEIDWIMEGNWDDQNLGQSMATLGSLSDPMFAIAAPGDFDSRVYLFRNEWEDTVPTAASVVLDGEDIPNLGTSMVSNHDHDGDGLADLVLTRAHFDGSPNSLLVFLEPHRLSGSLDVEDADIVFEIDANEARLRPHSLGDVDGDGWVDLGVGVHGAAPDVPGGLVVSWGRSNGTYDIESESSLFFYGPPLTFGSITDLDGDDHGELLVGTDVLYRLDLPLDSGTIDLIDATARAPLNSEHGDIDSIHTHAPELGRIPRTGIVASQVDEARGMLYLPGTEWEDEMMIGESGLSILGDAPGDALGTSVVFIEAFEDSEVGLVIGAPGRDIAGENAGALYRVAPPGSATQ